MLSGVSVFIHVFLKLFFSGMLKLEDSLVSGGIFCETQVKLVALGAVMGHQEEDRTEQGPPGQDRDPADRKPKRE